VRRDRGVVLGRPGSTPDDVVARVVREGKEGKTAYAFPRFEQGRCADCAGCAPGRKLRSARC
jgi:hypothetical protein